MSTIDPTLARKARAARRPSNARVAVLIVVLLLGGLGLGFGWGTVSQFFGEGDPPFVAVPGIILGMLFTVGGGIAWTGVVMRRADVGIAYGWSATLLGGGAGLLLAASNNGFPTLAVAIASALLLLAVVSLVLGVVAASTRRRRAARDEATARTGTLTTATVSDKGYDMFRESPRIITAVTFTFRDLQGVQRWVQRTMVVHLANPVVEGQETRLWYDAANPGDDRGIVVELARDNQLRG